MSIVRRTRSVARQGLKVQRRIALTQALFFPAVLVTGLAAGGVALAVWRSTKRDEQTPAGHDLPEGQVR